MSPTRSAPRRAADLRSALLSYADAEPDAIAVRLAFKSAQLTRRELLAKASAAAHALLRRGVGRGDRYVLALDNGLEFACWFWAGQLIGAVAVPVPPVSGGRRQSFEAQRVARIASAAQAKLVLSAAAGAPALAEALVGGGALLAAEAPLDQESSIPPHAKLSAGDLALLQFSSGSTSDPKGCALHHGAVYANALAAADRFDGRPGDTFFNWLPQFHDLGLMGGVIAPVVIGMRSIVLPPRTFVFDPLSWLRGLSACGPVHTSAPNFALALVLRRLRAGECRDLDLHDVKTIICGGEPIDVAIANCFVEALQPLGLGREALHPSYGLAECTVLVAARAGVHAAMPRDERTGSRLECAPDVCAPVVSLGTAVHATEIRITDASGAPVPAGQVGHVGVRSASCMRGYFGDAAATAAAINGEWLATGDLGFMRDGELYCVGRTKDVIIVAGRNLMAPEIDHCLSRALAIELSRIACFSWTDGTEQLGIAFEERHASVAEQLAASIRSTCFAQFGVLPALVVALPIGSLPKTTSGKIRRAAIARAYAGGSLALLPPVTASVPTA